MMRTCHTLLRKLLFLFTLLFQNPKSVIPYFINLNTGVEKFPFEIHQTGWGEFDIGVKIHFTDPAEKPVEIQHSLKLY